MDLAQATAMVTGGASGLGAATVRHLHSRGANVVIFDRDTAKGEALAAELGERVVFVAGDVLSVDDTEQAIAAATSLGGLRLLVACAGGARGAERTLNRGDVPHDLALFSDTVQLNLVGSFNTARLAAAAMAAQDPVTDDGERGAIVFVASIAGYEGQIGQVAYGAAKAGIIGMTLIAARDLASRGIRVNAIAPGTIRTEAWGLAPPEMLAGFEAQVPFPRRLGKPEEFAALVEHLATNGYINGHVVRIDGAIRFSPK
jgi:NAD(P)-dependent dehydrogenase (short-subunit alcohol dehydrogenase family)